MRTRIQSKRKRSTRKAFLTFLCTSILATPLAVPGRLIADELPRVSQLSEPPESTRLIVRTVRQLVEKAHILHPKINDEVSAHAFEAFLKNIDPMKSYFLASDIEEFKPYETKLDDLLRKNDIQFAYVAYKKYLERLEQVMPIVHQQIDAARAKLFHEDQHVRPRLLCAGGP